jgi:hypothetical protein
VYVKHWDIYVIIFSLRKIFLLSVCQLIQFKELREWKYYISNAILMVIKSSLFMDIHFLWPPDIQMYAIDITLAIHMLRLYEVTLSKKNLTNFLTLKMKAKQACKTWGTTHLITQHHIPKDLNLSSIRYQFHATQSMIGKMMSRTNLRNRKGKHLRLAECIS